MPGGATRQFRTLSSLRLRRRRKALAHNTRTNVQLYKSCSRGFGQRCIRDAPPPKTSDPRHRAADPHNAAHTRDKRKQRRISGHDVHVSLLPAPSRGTKKRDDNGKGRSVSPTYVLLAVGLRASSGSAPRPRLPTAAGERPRAQPCGMGRATSRPPANTSDEDVLLVLLGVGGVGSAAP